MGGKETAGNGRNMTVFSHANIGTVYNTFATHLCIVAHTKPSISVSFVTSIISTRFMYVLFNCDQEGTSSNITRQGRNKCLYGNGQKTH